MSPRTLIVVAIIGALLGSLAHMPEADMSLQGDFNGDNQVNVCDILAFLSLTTTTEAPGKASVSILDFQQIVACVQHSTPPATVPPREKPEKGCVFTHQLSPTLAPLKSVELFDYFLAVLVSPTPQHSRPEPVIFPSHEARYLFRLTPHAPPVSA